MRDKLRKFFHRKDNSAKGEKSGSTPVIKVTEPEPRSKAGNRASTLSIPSHEGPKFIDVGTESVAVAGKSTIIAPESPNVNSRESLWNQAYKDILHSEAKRLTNSKSSQRDESDVDSSYGLLDLEKKSSGTDICNQILDIAKNRRNSISHTKSSGKIRDFYEKIIGSVQKFVEVGDVVASVDPIHVGLPWAAVRFVLQMAVNDNEEYIAVLEGVETIATLIYRYAIFEHVYLGGKNPVQSRLKEGLEKTLKNMYEAILLYIFKANRYYSQTVPQRVLKSLVPTGGFQELLKDIKKKEAEVQEYASLDTRENDNFRYLELRRILAAYDDHLKREIRETILNWASPIPYRAHHRDICEEVLKNSGEWLFRRNEFIEWSSMTTSSLLWLRGDAGSGKTYLTSLVVDDLLQPHLDIQTALAFFYCSRTSGQSERQEPRDILRSIVRQLSSPVPGLPLKPPIVVKYEQERSLASPPTTLGRGESEQLIKKLLQEEYSSVTLVIDALDECDRRTRKDLFTFLAGLLKLPDTIVKVFVSSRNEPDIQEAFGNSDNLYIDASDNAEDIRRFVEQGVETRLLEGRAEDGLKQMVKERLCAKAQGIFRWVALQLDAICDPEFVFTAGDVKLKLDKLPETLQQTYAELFEKISQYSPESREVTERVIKWSMCAQQRLCTQDVLAAISINSDGTYEPRTRDLVLCLCRSLIVIDKKLDTFRLSHLSVKEYIEESKPVEYGEIQLHTTAAETCLLILDHHNKSLTNDPNVRGFYRYAVTHWAIHCNKAAQNRNADPLRGLYYYFALLPEVSMSFQEWLSAVHLLRSDVLRSDVLIKEKWQSENLLDSLCDPPSVFFAGCAYNLPEATAVTSMREPNINKRNWFGRTGLHIACRHGHHEMVKQLLQQGVDVEIQDDEGNVALFAALENGNVAIIKLLLSSVQNLQFTKTLMNAVARNTRNQKEVLDLLLSQDVIKLSEDLLLSAISKDFAHDVVELLLDRAGKIEVSENMLYAAARGPDGETLKMLLSREHDLQKMERLIPTLLKISPSRLQKALEGVRSIHISESTMKALARSFTVFGFEYKAMVKLLERDEELPITEEFVRIAVDSWEDQKALELLLLNRCKVIHMTEEILELAARNRFLDDKLFASLLDRNRNIQITERMLIAAVNGHNHKTLQLLLSLTERIRITEEVFAEAVVSRDSTIIKMIFGRDDVQITERHFKAAASCGNTEIMYSFLDQVDLQLTEKIFKKVAAYGDEAMMRMLLSRDNTLVTEEVLGKAAKRGNYEMMRLLLSRDGIRITEWVLKEAAFYANVELMQLLLSRDDTQITEGVLMEAALKGNVEMMQLLLSRDDTWITEGVLMEAAFEGNVEMMRLLLSRNDTRITEGVLRESVSRGKVKMIQLLLSRGDTQITEKILEQALVGNRTGEETMRLLLSHNGAQISENMLIRAVAFGNEEMIKLFLSQPEIQITERVLQCAAGRNIKILQLLLSQENVHITEKILKSAASSKDPEIMKVLLEVNSEARISEEVLKEMGEESMRLLLNQSRELDITEEVVKSAARRGGQGERLLRLWISRKVDFGITQNILEAGAGNFSLMKLLLGRDQEIQITDKIVKAAARYCIIDSEKMMRLLFSRNEEIQITEEIVEAAAENYSPDVMEFLLGLKPGIEITETMLVNAVKTTTGGPKIKFMLSQDRKIQVTDKVLDEVLEAAARDPFFQGTSMQLLLNLDDGYQISNATLQVFATDGRDDMLRLLRDRVGENSDFEYFWSIAKLRHAITSGDKLLVQRLLQDGVSLNWKDSSGESPLLLAVRLMRRSIVRLLLKSGAYALGQANEDSNLLSVVPQNRKKEMRRILEKHRLAQSQRLEPRVQEVDE